MIRPVFVLILLVWFPSFASAQVAKPTAEEAAEIQKLIKELDSFPLAERVTAAKALAPFSAMVSESVSGASSVAMAVPAVYANAVASKRRIIGV